MNVVVVRKFHLLVGFWTKMRVVWGGCWGVVGGGGGGRCLTTTLVTACWSRHGWLTVGHDMLVVAPQDRGLARMAAERRASPMPVLPFFCSPLARWRLLQHDDKRKRYFEKTFASVGVVVVESVSTSDLLVSGLR